jgi:hypothetical protein
VLRFNEDPLVAVWPCRRERQWAAGLEPTQPTAVGPYGDGPRKTFSAERHLSPLPRRRLSARGVYRPAMPFALIVGGWVLLWLSTGPPVWLSAGRPGS